MTTSMKSSIVANQVSQYIQKTLLFQLNDQERGGDTILIPNQDLTVKDFVVSEDIENHLLVEIFRGCLECDFHAACFFCFEVDISSFYQCQSFFCFRVEF